MLVYFALACVLFDGVKCAVTLKPPTNYDDNAMIPAPYSKDEGYPFSSSVGNTQSKEVLNNAAGYWPCLRVPEGVDERYPVMKDGGGGFFNSNKFCDLSKQPGKSMYSCRGMYPLYKTKNYPKLPAPHCFNKTGVWSASDIKKMDNVQKEGDLCQKFVGAATITPVDAYVGISDTWIVTNTNLKCPADMWSHSAGTKDTFCNQVSGIDEMHVCDYAKEAKTRPHMHACWDVCADTFNRCQLSSVFGMGSLISSQDYEPKDYVAGLKPLETVDSWCMFLSWDNVCLPMEYYYPDGKETMNSCYPNGVWSLDAKDGLPTDHEFKGTKGNFFRKDGKVMKDLEGNLKGDSTDSAGYVRGIVGLLMLIATLFA